MECLDLDELNQWLDENIATLRKRGANNHNVDDILRQFEISGIDFLRSHPEDCRSSLKPMDAKEDSEDEELRSSGKLECDSNSRAESTVHESQTKHSIQTQSQNTRPLSSHRKTPSTTPEVPTPKPIMAPIQTCQKLITHSLPPSLTNGNPLESRETSSFSLPKSRLQDPPVKHKDELCVEITEGDTKSGKYRTIIVNSPDITIGKNIIKCLQANNYEGTSGEMEVLCRRGERLKDVYKCLQANAKPLAIGRMGYSSEKIQIWLVGSKVRVLNY